VTARQVKRMDVGAGDGACGTNLREPMSTNAASPVWRAARHQDRRPLLLTRNVMADAVRGWFRDEGFLEVEAGALQVSPGNETHLHAMRIEVAAPDGGRCTRYLHTSPEFAMKKLLAAGEPLIFSLGAVYRDRELTPLHAPSFTMLEWYRANAPYAAIMDDTVELVRMAAAAAGVATLRRGESEADLRAPAERLRVAAAFRQWAAMDLDAIGTDRGAFAAAAGQVGVRVVEDDDWSDIFSRVLVERVEHHLGKGRLTILHDYPASEAALARLAPGQPGQAPVAERFELYACGVELANGFGELTDADEQRRRFAVAMDRKQRIYGERYPVDEDFLAAVDAMPPASGVALGFDRLVMLATGAPTVHHVQWTPSDLAARFLG